MQISVYQHQESTRPLLVNNKGTMSLWELDAFGWMASRGIGFLTCARQKKLSISADKHARLAYRALCVPPQKRSACITQTANYCTAMDSHERAYPPNKLKDQWMYTYRIYGGWLSSRVPLTTTIHGQRGLATLRNRRSKNPWVVKLEFPRKKVTANSKPKTEGI